MTDGQQTAKDAYDKEAARQLGAELGAALEAVGKSLRAWGDNMKRNSELAALAGLYRYLRALDISGGLDGKTPDEARHALQDEIRARMNASIKGCDVAHLAELATFGGWLADAAAKEWRSRT